MEQDHLTGGFFGTGKHATHHHGVRTCGDGFGDVARIANAAVGNHRHAAALQRCGDRVDGHDLRHADPSHDARGANRAWADAHFHTISTGFDQGQCGSARGDVAADDIDVRITAFDPAHALDDTRAVAVRGVHHQGVDPCTREQFNALFCAIAHAHGCGHAQLAL